MVGIESLYPNSKLCKTLLLPKASTKPTEIINKHLLKLYESQPKHTEMKQIAISYLLLLIAKCLLCQTVDSSLATKDLFFKAFNSNSNTFKIKSYSIIKKRAEKNPYSLFVAAFMNEYDDSLAIARNKYYDCLRKYPNFLPALYQLAGLEQNDLKSIELQKKIVYADFTFRKYSALRNVFFKYVENLKNDDSAFAFLTRIQNQNPNVFIFDYIRAEYYFKRKQHEKASDFVDKAFKLDSNYEDLLILKSDIDLTAGHQDFLFHLREKFELDPSREIVGQYIISTFYWGLRSQEDRKIFLENTFARVIDSVNSSHIPLMIVEYLLKLNRNGYSVELFSALLKLCEVFPDDHIVLAHTAQAYLKLYEDTINAKRFILSAINNSFSGKDKFDNISLFNNILLINKDSYKTIDSVLAANATINTERTLYERYKVNLYKNEPSFDKALNNLTKFINSKTSDSNNIFSNGLIEINKRELQSLINERKSSDSVYLHNNILKSWKHLFGNQISISLLFEENSSTYNNKNDEMLGKLKHFIEATGIKNCSFLIEGHAAVNESNGDALSLERAKTILKYFAGSFNLTESNLKIKSFGANYPVASNNIKSERFKNCRVDVSPNWIFTDPKVLATSALIAEKTIAISPDGNFIVTGNSPLQLWDLKLKILLKEFGPASDAVKFSPDGRYVATIDNSEIKDELIQSALSIYDIKTGLLYDKIPWSNRIEDFSWNPFSAKIAIITWDGFILIYDLLEKQKSNIKRIRFDGTRPRCIVWTKDDKYLINGYAAEKNLSVWNADNLELEKQLRGSYWPHALEQSKDGGLLFCASNSRFLSIWDLKTWNRVDMSIPVLSGQIAVHPYKSELLLDDWGAGDRNRLVLVDFEKKKILKSKLVYQEDIHYAYTPDGESIYQALTDSIKILNAETLEEKSNIVGLSYKAIDCKEDTINNLFLTHDKDGIHAIDVTSGLERFHWNVKAKILKENSALSNEFIVTVEKDSTTEIYSLDSKTFEHKLLSIFNSQIDLIECAKGCIVFACKEFSKPNFGLKTGFLEITNSTLKHKRKIDVPLLTRDLDNEKLTGSGFLSLALSPDQTRVSYSSYWLDGFRKGNAISNIVNSYGLQTGEKTDSISVTQDIYSLSYLTPNSLVLTSLYGSYEYNHDTKAIKYYSNLLPEQKRITNGKGNLELVWSNNFIKISNKNILVKEISFKNNLIGVQIFEKQNLLIALTNANKTIFYDLKSFEERLTIVSKKENEWIAYTPQGNFQASLFGSENVFWSYGDAYIEFSQLRNEYENTQLVSRQLSLIKNGVFITDTSYKSAIIAKFKISNAFKILSDKDLKTDSSSYVLEFTFDKTKLEGVSVKGWQIQIYYRKNGNNPLITTYDLDSLMAQKDFLRFKKTYEIEDGSNSIWVNVLPINDQERDPYKDNIDITKRPAFSTPKGKNLYYLGIAVDKFRDSSLSLQYPVKDAIEVAKILKLQEGSQYQTVDTLLVLNDAVNDLNNYANQFVKKVIAHDNDSDIVIIYLSGHGIIKDSHLYFMMNKNKKDEPMPGYPDDYFYLPLTSLTPHLARENKLFLMDMCQSNNSYHRPSDKGVIMPACWATESSIEDSTIGGKHGLFTCALIEGINGEADKVKSGKLGTDVISLGNENGLIELGELLLYIKRRVTFLSKDMQNVDPPSLDPIKDYPISKILKK